MDRTEFTDHAPGTVRKTATDYWAFVPAPLPPRELPWDTELIAELSTADRAVGRLSGVAQTLTNPNLLIAPFMRREAVLSSRIEGTQASLSDLFLFEAAPSATPQAPDVREVANYVKALTYGLSRQQTLPVSLRLLRELHAKLLEDVRGEHLTPGEFRRSQNWIGSPRSPLSDARYVPPPPDQLQGCLGDFEIFLHQPSSIPPLVRLALIHYQFEAIHPFLDGNGRIGRLLIALLLAVDGVLPQPLLYLSAYFERHRAAYYDHLLAVSQRGEWAAWIKFFLRGVSEQASDAVVRSTQLLALRDQFRAKCQVARASALTIKLVDQLFNVPAITTTMAKDFLGVTFRSAQGCIDTLERNGVLEEVTGNARGRIYVARQIINTVSQPTAEAASDSADVAAPSSTAGTVTTSGE
jgi:Fic family protein